ncbi:hypothetical protein ACFL5Z_17895 [Planctomycetota bacterium]
MLRIISLIAAVMAGVFFVFPVIYGVDSDEQVKEFLKTPEVREKFENAADSRINRNKDLTSPLVKQARAFASYLNPKPTAKRSPTASKRSTIKSALPVTPKFKLRGTSYCENDPNMSLALIDEPGKGRHWVGPSSKVGHLLIEQIKDGLIVVQSSEETFELAIEESTVKSVSPPPRRTSSQARFSPKLPVSSKKPATISRPSTTVSLKQEPEENERDTRAKALIEKLRNLQKDTVSDKTAGVEDKDKAARIERLISQYQSTRISPEEAKKLGNLGKTLKDAESDPNGTSSK